MRIATATLLGELGYLLSGHDLARPDSQIDGFGARTSVRALLQSGALLSELIRGPASLGTLLEEGGFGAVPSSNQPDPGSESFFSGAYSTRRHGSVGGGAVSGAQVEMLWPGLRDTEANRARFAGVLARAVADFFAVHHGRPLQR